MMQRVDVESGIFGSERKYVPGSAFSVQGSGSGFRGLGFGVRRRSQASVTLLGQDIGNTQLFSLLLFSSLFLASADW
jgi:hypothetical protein